MILFNIFFILISSSTAHVLPRTNLSDLCSRASTHSCSHFLRPNNPVQEETCQLSVANNSHPQLCNSSPWLYGSLCKSDDSCGIQLEVYRHVFPQMTSLYRTAFNLSISTNLEQDIRIRYRDRNTHTFSFCLNFTLLHHFDHSSLWYDCVFHIRNFEGEPFFLEFISGDQYGKLLFQVPKGNFYNIFFKSSTFILNFFLQRKI